MSERPVHEPLLAVQLGELALRNPLLSASGTYGHGLEMQHFAPPASLGGLVSKTVTLLPRAGNPEPRLCETSAGLLNSIGLENRGLEHYLAHTLPSMQEADTLVVTNVGGECIDDFVAVVERLSREQRIDALELNLSCPNVQGGRLPFGTDPENAERVLRATSAVTDKPLWAKLSPNVTRIAEMAQAVEVGGADAVTAINTLLGMAVDWRTGRPGLNTVQGGYSGPGIKPVALRCAWECAEAVSIPVIGCGGIVDADDVLEFLSVGCAAVQVGTSSFSDPGCLGRMAAELVAALADAGVGAVSEVIGNLGRAARSEALASGAAS